MVDYKKKYLKYKKKYLQSKKIFNKKSLGGASPIHSLKVASESAPSLARTLLLVTINLTRNDNRTVQALSLGSILTERNVLDTYNIGMPQIQNLKDSIARKLTNFPLGDHQLAQVECKAQHGVLAYDSWVEDAFREPGKYDDSDLSERIRNFLNENVEYNCYTDVIKCILGREFSNSKQIRHILESKVGAQNQCNKIINEFQEGTACYLCGLPIKNYDTGTAHCEHLIPVGQALAIYWLAKKTRFTPAEKAFLSNEYKWSCSCCNRLKGNDPFINPPTLNGAPFMISDDLIKNFVRHLCDLIDQEVRVDRVDIKKRVQLTGTEKLDILCQRKRYFEELDYGCNPKWKEQRETAIHEAFRPVLENINYNFLKKGGAESEKKNIIESGRAAIFLELTKIEMMVKIILALGDEGLVELFCKTDVPRRSVVQLNPSSVPVFPKKQSFRMTKSNLGRKLPSTMPKKLQLEEMDKISRRKKKKQIMNKKKREEAKVAAAEAEKRLEAEERENIFQQAQARDKRRDRRGANPDQFGSPARSSDLDPFRFESLDSDPKWRDNPFRFGSPTRDRKGLNGGDRESQGRGSGHQGGVENFIWETSEKQAGGKTLSKLIPNLLQYFEKPELKEKISISLQNFEKPELKEKIYTVDKENADTGLEKLKSEDPQVIKEKCIDPRGFTKYLLFEILEEIIEYLPKNNILILFVIKLLIDDDMNTLFFETYYTKNNTQFEILINELTEIIENWKIPPTEV